MLEKLIDVWNLVFEPHDLDAKVDYKEEAKKINPLTRLNECIKHLHLIWYYCNEMLNNDEYNNWIISTNLARLQTKYYSHLHMLLQLDEPMYFEHMTDLNKIQECVGAAMQTIERLHRKDNDPRRNWTIDEKRQNCEMSEVLEKYFVGNSSAEFIRKLDDYDAVEAYRRKHGFVKLDY